VHDDERAASPRSEGADLLTVAHVHHLLRVPSLANARCSHAHQRGKQVGHVVAEEEEERGTENKEVPSSILRSAWARRLDEVGRHESHGRRGEVRFFAFPVSVSILLSRRYAVLF